MVEVYIASLMVIYCHFHFKIWIKKMDHSACSKRIYGMLYWV